MRVPNSDTYDTLVSLWRHAPLKPAFAGACVRIKNKTKIGKVVALEANKILLDAASELGREGSLQMTIPSVEGSSVTQRVSLSPAANPERINFKQCDPMCLPAGLAGETAG